MTLKYLKKHALFILPFFSLSPFMKNKTHWVFILLLIAGFVFRLVRFPQNYEINGFEVTRDYLVAHHIVRYHEFPAIGPVNSIYNALPNSPFYYYVLATPLLVYDHIYTLAVFNILLQFITIIVLYTLAFTLFGSTTALLTGLLLLWNEQVITQSFGLWQPTVVQPFFYLSYLFLAIGYQKKSFLWIVNACVCFMIAMNSALYGFPAFPFFIFALSIVLKKIHTPPAKWRLIVGIFLCLGLLAYIPVVIYLYHTHQFLFFVQEPVYIQTLFEYIQRFGITFMLAITGWMSGSLLPEQLKNGLFLAILACNGYYFLVCQDKKLRYIQIIAAYILFVIIISSSLQDKVVSYHFASILGIIVILISHVSVSIWPKNISGYTGKIISIVALLCLVSPGPAYIRFRMKETNIYEIQTHAIKSILNQIRPIQKQYGVEWPTYIRFAYYNDQDAWNSDSFTPLLEVATHTKLTTISNTLDTAFYPLENKNRYIFVVCQGYEHVRAANDRCIPKFLKEYPDFFVDEPFYTGGSFGTYTIYQATHT